MTERDLPPGASVGLLSQLARAATKIRADLPLVGLDLLLASLGYLTVLVLRFDGAIPPRFWAGFLGTFLPVALVVHLLVNAVSGLYGKLWRHASVDEARRVVIAGLGATAILAVSFLPTSGLRTAPASVVLLGGMIALLLFGGLRFQSRLFWSHRRHEHADARGVIVLGAGSAGSAVVRDMLADDDSGYVPVAILDDDPRKQRRDLAGVPIVGGLGDLAEAARRLQPDVALLAMPSADGELVRRLVSEADAVGLTVKTVPRLSELTGSEVGMRDVRDLEIADLLGREQVATDLDAVRGILVGRRVLITGAGGSIGREIARQVAQCEPAELVLVDHDETHLHEAAAAISQPSVQALADVRDRAAVEDAFLRHQPEVVFHAAAHKHVPLLEAHPWEAVTTNIAGTEHVVDAAARHEVEHFVFISTDKAVRPSSVMGATKRIGEQLVRMYAPEGSKWCAVRFGNVLGSRGSVIPTFMRQIAAGGPVTVTDPRMERYFMSIEEAVQLVLQAAALTREREVFMLDMGEPVAITHLAERMIRLSGRRVGDDIEIVYTGLRPGEKLAEELRNPGEEASPTAHPSIVSLDAGTIELALAERLKELYAAAEARNGDLIRRMVLGVSVEESPGHAASSTAS